MQLATTTADFYHYTHSSAECVRLYEGTGFRHLDYSFYNVIHPGSSFLGEGWMEEVRAAAREAERLGFDFVQAHAPNYNSLSATADHEAGMLATRRSIQACGYLGVHKLVIHTCFSDSLRYPRDKEAYFKAAREFLLPFGEDMVKYDVNLLIENSAEENMGGKYFFLTPGDMLDFIRYFDHPMLHVCWDVGHANMRGTDPFLDVTALGRELYALHVQDNFGTYDEHVAPFMGTLPLDSLMQGLLKTGYSGYFTMECDNMLSPAQGWPHPRREFPLPTPARLRGPSPAIKQKAIALLYEIGRYILEEYDCFED